MRIAVLTSGGDAPGMNPCIRSVVRVGLSKGHIITGLIDGFKGLVHWNIYDLPTKGVGGILQRGGTILGTSRYKSFKRSDYRKKALDNLRGQSIEGLIIIGGDGSLRAANKLSQENFPTVLIPATIDNDIACTDYSIGFDTAVNTVLEAIYRLRDTAEAHRRVVIVETMGRSSSHIAVNAGLAGGAEIILTPECPIDPDEVAQSVKRFFRVKKKRFVMIVLAEGAGKADKIAKIINSSTPNDVSTTATVLGYIQRGGTPTAFDTILASRFGALAIEAFNADKNHSCGWMTCWSKGEYQLVPIKEVLKKQKPFYRTNYELNETLAQF
jgi:6-phosphofructokinase 1